MTPTTFERFFLRRYRFRLLKALDGPFNPDVSHHLEAVDLLLGVSESRPARDLWERTDTPDGKKIFVPLGS